MSTGAPEGRGAPHRNSPREIARRVLERVARTDAWATLAIDAELSRVRLPDRDSRLVTELVYGVLRNQQRIDVALGAYANLKKTPPRVLLALRLAAYQIIFLRVPDYASVDDAVNAVRAIGGAKLAGFANGVLRSLVRKGEPALPPPGRARIELEHSLPAWIVDEIDRVKAPTDELAEVAAGFAEAPRLAIRTNLRRGTRATLADELRAAGATVEEVPDSDVGLWVDGLGDPSTSTLFGAGRFTIQDVGAQRVAELTAPRPNEYILDACAGVGGKSTHLAELTNDTATIDAADLSTVKLAHLGTAAARLGLSHIRPVRADLTAAANTLRATYGRVVIDAPCSGLGVLRRHPEAKTRLAVADLARVAILQATLLDALAPRVAVGGVLVYSVCSFTAAETDEQLTGFLARHPQFVVDDGPHRTWPHRDHADGFYAVRLRRSS